MCGGARGTRSKGCQREHCRLYDTSSIVRLIYTPASGREDEHVGVRLPVPESLGLQLTRELGVIGTVPELRLLFVSCFPSKETVASPDADDRIVFELKVSPPQSLELRDSESSFRKEAHQQPILWRGERSKQTQELLD